MRRSSSCDFGDSSSTWAEYWDDESTPAPIQEAPTASLLSSKSRQNRKLQNNRGKRSSAPATVSFPDSSADTDMRSVGVTANPSIDERGSAGTHEKQFRAEKKKSRRRRSRIYDDPSIVAGYASVPLLELDRLPRGGISLETEAVGRIQFGIPPETIKDSMRLGFGVPSVYIVPVERFCREIGPALGINLAEFEFPAYFNYFIRLKRCTLIVDSLDAESNIRRVFGETLLGPAAFRNHNSEKPNEDEDFDPSFPKESRPNFYKEFYHFRTAEEASNYQELTIDMLLDFCHFHKGAEQSRRGNRFSRDKLGVPPHPPSGFWSGVKEEMTKMRRRRTTLFPVGDERRQPGHDLTNVSRDRKPVSEFAEEVPRTSGTLSDVEEEGEDDSNQRPRTLRRTRSDPDMKRLSIDSSSHSIPSSPSYDTSAAAEQKDHTRRGSVDSTASFMSRGGRSRGGMSWADGASFMLASDDEDDPSRNTWMYSQAKWLGEVATVYPPTSTDEQKKKNQGKRVEIFKMTGGTEYIVHDVDENNFIVGKARFSGTVRVPDEIAVEGFLTTTDNEDFRNNASAMNDSIDLEDFNCDGESDIEGEGDDDGTAGERRRSGIEHDFHFSIPRPAIPKTFHPPSFGVTVLGNSHGFDKNGSVSGYVLWVNGRGVMIDPPPYSSATLEREGIRPQMIVAIIITHCHADHDAGTFQKVMTGLRVAIITTPTIYKSFIRKYAALSGLNPTLLRHSHRHRAAIVGQPLRFQGATFNFTYTLHTIPCIAFKVEWRDRSMVFTGDHLNSPPVIDNLEKTGVLTTERADDLRRLPLQECDALLHEAGAPPIHTPLAVLKALPDHVKERLYVVHTSALPDDCELRVAPTGTAGTIRLDRLRKENKPWVPRTSGDRLNGFETPRDLEKKPDKMAECVEEGARPVACEEDSQLQLVGPTAITASDGVIDAASLDDGGYPNLSVAGSFVCPNFLALKKNNHGDVESSKLPPLVFLRPPCVSDAWFILNLLSAVPFLSSLSYSNTMEILEIAQVEMYCENDVVISSDRRSEVLCVVWEGTCIERDPLTQGSADSYLATYSRSRMSDEMENDDTHFSNLDDGVLRRLNPTVWHAGDWTGPVALQPETERSTEILRGGIQKDIVASSPEGVKVIVLNMKDLYKILKSGSKLFRKYLAQTEKKVAEESAMKAHMMRNEPMLQTGSEDQLPNHWNAFDGVLDVIKCNSALGKLSALQKRHLESLAEGPRFFEAGQHLWQVGDPVEFAFLIVTGTAVFASKHEEQRIMNRRATTGFMFPGASEGKRPKRVGVQRIQEDKQLFNVSPNSEYARLEVGLQLRVEEMELDDVYEQSGNLLPKEERMKNARDRFANKVLARLYSRRAYTAGLVFSRGHWLSDTSRMVSGSLAHINYINRREDRKERKPQNVAGDHHCHTSNMVAGPDGCAVMVFPRPSLVQFLEGHPGVLLSLLGTQVVV